MKRSAPLKRKTALKSMTQLRRVTYLQPKRSTVTPTKAQVRRMQAIYLSGCVVCRFHFGWMSPPEIHHLTVGGKHGQKRRGHTYTIGLCPWHHRGVGDQEAFDYRSLIGPSYALEPRAFREQFGSDDALLRIQNEYVAEMLT